MEITARVDILFFNGHAHIKETILAFGLFNQLPEFKQG
jgi:hypothetical protein